SIHNPKHPGQGASSDYGRHQDINFNKIICFERSGSKDEIVLVISDFSLSTFNRLHQRPDCSDFLHDAVDGVANEMLVVMTQSRSRSSSGQTFDAFQMLSSKRPKKDVLVIDKPWTGEKI
ncbi:hypothetical protein FocTR4_00016555, partial [Fusarium oxysporum f. sp. cubense]